MLGRRQQGYCRAERTVAAGGSRWRYSLCELVFDIWYRFEVRGRASSVERTLFWQKVGYA